MNGTLVKHRNRHNTGSLKWDGVAKKFGSRDLLPMWVADMDFQAPDCVNQALQSVLDLGVYGYYAAGESYWEAFIQWEKERHSYSVKRDWLRFTPGVVPAVYWLVACLTEPGDACAILTPSYYPFMDSIEDLNRRLISTPLTERDGIYSIDFELFENNLASSGAKLFIHCSPHNPVGRVWNEDELKKLLLVCRRHGVQVISDEIHQDLILPGFKHLPTATAADDADKVITLTSASKTFNLAGVNTAFAVIPDPDQRAAFDRYAGNIRAGGTVFGYTAVEAAYRHGLPWLEELLEIVGGNERTVRSRLAKELPQAVVSPLEGTYLLWVDLGAYIPHADLVKAVQEDCHLAVDYGDWFSRIPGDTHIRLNLATDNATVEEATSRLVHGIMKYIQK